MEVTVSWETCMQVKKQQLEPDVEQLMGSKLGDKRKVVAEWYEAGILGLWRRQIQSGARHEAGSLRAFV